MAIDEASERKSEKKSEKILMRITDLRKYQWTWEQKRERMIEEDRRLEMETTVGNPG